MWRTNVINIAPKGSWAIEAAACGRPQLIRAGRLAHRRRRRHFVGLPVSSPAWAWRLGLALGFGERAWQASLPAGLRAAFWLACLARRAQKLPGQMRAWLDVGAQLDVARDLFSSLLLAASSCLELGPELGLGIELGLGSEPRSEMMTN